MYDLREESIWESGEPRGGPTEAWLVEQATAHGIYIGASYLEAEGEDFYNTFTLVAPGGKVAGRVRKESLPGFEGWWFKSCARDKVIDTSLGRIAVGICQDNHTARFMRRLCRDDVDREGIVVADVHLDPSRKRRPQEPSDVYWSNKPKRFPRTFGALFMALEVVAKRAYARSPKRPRAARRVAKPS